MYIGSTQTGGQALSTSAWKRAVTMNRVYGRELGWKAHTRQLAATLGLTMKTPDVWSLAQALAHWQQRNGLPVDGVLGPNTWARLRAAIGISDLTRPGLAGSGLGETEQEVDDYLKKLWAKLPNCFFSDFLRMLYGQTPKHICVLDLGKTFKGNHVQAYFFPGTSEERALVIGGVHGSERSGIEVAKRLVKSLHETAAKPPYFNTMIVPVLFPDNEQVSRAVSHAPGEDSNAGRYTDKARCPKYKSDDGKIVCADPNRQFPAKGKPFDPKNPIDSLGRKIETENVYLLNLIAFYKPTRIASIHAHSMPAKLKRDKDAPGIFADPHPPKGDKVADARTQADCDLALAMAHHAHKKGARLPGNWLDSSQPTCFYGSPSTIQGGISLGGWGPSRGISVITVEVQHYYPTSVTGKPGTRANGFQPESEAGVKNRLKEIRAFCSAIREIFLGSPGGAP
jgi:Putative peptidoglycan binding domain/Zinc carboxypeptidase